MSYFGEVISEPPPDIVTNKLESIAKQDLERKSKSSSLSRQRKETPTELQSIRFGKFNNIITSDPKQNAGAARSSDEGDESTFESTLTKSLREENNKPSSSVEDHRENQFSKELINVEEEQMDLKHFVSTTGLMIDWSPIFWRLDFLPHKKISFHLCNSLEKFGNIDAKNDTIIVEGVKFWDIFKTQQQDRFFLSALLQELHIFRQNYKTYTPFVITSKSHSDLPFPVSVISQCITHPDGITLLTDECNQKTKRSKNGQFYPIMFDIYPSSKPGKETIVTDFRGPFSMDSIKTAFLMNIDKVRDSFREIRSNGRAMIFIRENSVLQQVIEALSEVKTPAFDRIKIVAAQLMIEMNNAQRMPLDKDDSSLWFSHLSADNVYEIVNFIENITNSIPKYKHLALKIVPEDGTRWTDYSSWSRRYVRSAALDTYVSPVDSDGKKLSRTQITDHICRNVDFNIWIDLTVYFI